MFHFHKWEQFVDISIYSKTDFRVDRIYRHCKKCDRWQRAHAESDFLFTDIVWKNSNKPDGLEKLLTYEEARKKIRELKLEKESARESF